MIKLVASDLDGTLLTDDKKLPPDMFDIIKNLNKKDIQFVPASGRQICSLERFFAPFSENMALIAENGGFMTYRGEEIFSSVMKPQFVREILEDVLSMGKYKVLLCGKYNSFTDDPTTVEKMKSSWFKYNSEYVDDILDVKEDIIKISVVDDYNIMQRYYDKLAPKYKDRFGITISGFNCMDFMNKGVSKGYALRLLKKRLGISSEETVSFGDNLNDVEMFEEAGFSYAMQKSSNAVKSRARFIAGDNNKFAVAEEIKKLCQI